ncbi:MAG: hypothetical protein ACRDO2_09990, partial [Nocardioidaceae bacterium]
SGQLPQADPAEQSSGLTVTRSDGSTFVLDELQVLCQKGRSVADEESLLIVGYPAERPGLTFFMLEAVLSDIAQGATITLPPKGTPSRRFILFVNDPETDNELSSAEEESSGTVVVESASCDPKPTAMIHVDATLGSEMSDLPTADVSGTIVLSGSEPPVTEP